MSIEQWEEGFKEGYNEGVEAWKETLKNTKRCDLKEIETYAQEIHNLATRITTGNLSHTKANIKSWTEKMMVKVRKLKKTLKHNSHE